MSTALCTRVKSRVFRSLKLDRRLRDWDDERYLKLLWRVRMGGRLRLNAPRTFNEKLQWLKLHDRRPIYTTMVDKYEVKQWVAARIGSSYVVPSLGVWDSFDAIDFASLPDQFVLKCTHDSGGLVICADRASLDFGSARQKIEQSLSRNYYRLGREWPYRDVTPRVLAEVYLPGWMPSAADATASARNEPWSDGTSVEVGLLDYKFYCFHGEPRFLYVSEGLHDHSTAKMDFLTLDWEPTGFTRSDYLRFSQLPPKPEHLETMIGIARKLSTGIPFVRVDLFEHAGQVLFSEMTFHPVSGMMPVSPKSADHEIGKLLDLSQVALTD